MPSYFHSTSQSPGAPSLRVELARREVERMREEERIRLAEVGAAGFAATR